MRQQIVIAAEVAETEQAGIKSGANYLAACIKKARPDDAPRIALAFPPEGHDVSTGPRIDIYIASMLPELGGPAKSPSAILAHWTERLRHLQAHVGHVFLCTVFRHVPDRTGNGMPDDKLARIRMLNLLVAQLSQMHGANVIDLDCALAGFGARALGTDYTLQGAPAATVAGHTLATAVLLANLDDVFDDALLDGAQEALQRHYAIGPAMFRPPASEPTGA